MYCEYKKIQYLYWNVLYLRMKNANNLLLWYEHMFWVIVKECKKHYLYPNPLNFNLDFEFAVINVLKLIFGNHINIIGLF